MKLKPANISAIRRRLMAMVLCAVALTPGALAQDDNALPAATVAAADNLINAAVYDALLSAGAGEERARAAAQSVANTGQFVAKTDLDQFVTKTDLAEAKSELVTKTDLAEAKSELASKADLAEVKSELKAEIAQLRNDLILLGAGTAGAIVLMMLAGFHMLWRRISELAERLPHAA